MDHERVTLSRCPTVGGMLRQKLSPVSHYGRLASCRTANTRHHVESVEARAGAAVEGLQTGPSDEVDNGPENEDVARTFPSAETRADVGHEPLRRARGEIAFACVQAHAGEMLFPGGAANRARAANRCGADRRTPRIPADASAPRRCRQTARLPRRPSPADARPERAFSSPRDAAQRIVASMRSDSTGARDALRNRSMVSSIIRLIADGGGRWSCPGSSTKRAEPGSRRTGPPRASGGGRPLMHHQ